MSLPGQGGSPALSGGILKAENQGVVLVSNASIQGTDVELSGGGTLAIGAWGSGALTQLTVSGDAYSGVAVLPDMSGNPTPAASGTFENVTFHGGMPVTLYNSIALVKGTLTNTGAFNLGDPAFPTSTRGTLWVSGTANLDGTFSLSLANGVTVAIGDTITVMMYGAHTGNFAAYTGLRLSSGLGTTMTLLDGTAIASTSIHVSISDAGSFALTAGGSLASDIVDFSGTGTGKFVLQLDYNDAEVLASGRSVLDLFLGWRTSSGEWVNAVQGNSDGGASSLRVLGAYDPANDFQLGTWGIDTVDDRVWAVIDHNSTFGAVAPETARGLLLEIAPSISLRYLP